MQVIIVRSHIQYRDHRKRSDDLNSDAFATAIDLAQNSSLRTVEFLSLTPDRLHENPHSWIINTLAQITSQFICKVVLEVHFYGEHELGRHLEISAALAALFAGGNAALSKCSTKLEIIVCTVSDRRSVVDGVIRDRFREKLPDLHNQGRLEFISRLIDPLWYVLSA